MKFCACLKEKKLCFFFVYSVLWCYGELSHPHPNVLVLLLNSPWAKHPAILMVEEISNIPATGKTHLWMDIVLWRVFRYERLNQKRVKSTILKCVYNFLVANVGLRFVKPFSWCLAGIEKAAPQYWAHKACKHKKRLLNKSILPAKTPHTCSYHCCHWYPSRFLLSQEIC